jgi:hypothetical protein
MPFMVNGTRQAQVHAHAQRTQPLRRARKVVQRTTLIMPLMIYNNVVAGAD